MESVSCAKFEYEADNLLEECKKLRNMPEKDLSDSLIETKLESLDEDWQNLRSAFESVFFAGTEDEEDKQYKIKVKKYYESVRDNYQVTKATLLEILKNRKAQSQSNNARGEVTNPSLFHSSAVYPPGTTFDMSEICIKVPPCDTQDFYGSYEEWPTFRDMFTAIYGNHPRLTPAQKLYHLRNKTKGEAGRIVDRYPLSDQNFSLAWEALSVRYENVRVLVDNQLKILFNLSAATVESSKDIKRIQSTVSDCLAILRAHSVKVDQWDPILIYLCSTKLPVDTLTLWEQSLESHSELPKWSQMEDFLKNRHRVLERIDGLRSQTASTSFSNDHISHQNAHLTQSNRCVMCYKNHILKNCMRFNNMTVNQRIEFAREKRLCNNCLTSGHISQECVSVHRCMFCKKKHHTKLHLQSNGQERSIQPRNVTRDNQAPVRSANGRQTNTLVTTDNTIDEMPCSSSSIVQASNVETHVSVCHDDIMLPTALVKVKHAGELFTVRALIDSASKRTFITQKIVKRIGLCTEKANFKISGLSGTVVANSNKKCMLTLCSDTINNEIETEALIVQNLTSLLPTQTVSISDLGSIKELKLADPGFMISAQVDMLIGSDVIPQIILEGVKKNILGNMVAQNSIYGWYIYGPIKSNEICLASVEVEEHSEDDISSALKKFWEQEEVNNVPIATESDNYCEEFYANTTYRRSDGKFVVKLPFKDEFPNKKYLDSSRFEAKRQYEHMEAKLRKNKEVEKSYNDVLNEYLSLGHMKPTNSKEICNDGKYYSYYLPHHAVFRPESTSTKVRVVFNGSSKTKSSYSLNDVLHTGPILQNDLVSVILNWRLYKYVFNGDIEKMYRQIYVHPSDRQYQRILFRKDVNEEVKDYELCTVTFGINCAPYLAIRTLLQLAEESSEKSPIASKIIKNELYVDDVLTGGHTIASALEAQKQLIDTLHSAGFPLKKITANHPSLLSNVRSEDLLNEEFLRIEDMSSTKTLGIRWNAITDSFSYSMKSLEVTGQITKRKILSTVSKLFDPAGWLTPLIVQAKILLQDLWLEGINWDDKVSSSTLIKWKNFVEQFSKIDSIQIPRWINFCLEGTIQIHGFCDASEKAYCATIYIRMNTENSTTVKLLMAKSKVAPLKKISLPRLELCGAVLLSSLVKYVVSNLTIKNYSVHLWTDSTIVLGWLQKHPSTWNTYVANRTALIFQNVENGKWRHVSTKCNPADLGTRGSSTEDLCSNSLWWNGPIWLLSTENNWPKSSIILQDPPEQRKIVVHCAPIIDKDNLIINKFSSYNKALWVVGYIFRMKKRKEKNEKSELSNGKILSHEELNHAKLVLVRTTQMFHYPQEYNDLSNSKDISRQSTLRALNPFLDKDGIIRVNGRLANANISYDERFPIILPNSSHFCKIFLEFIHKTMLHADISLMMSTVRSQFYIPCLRRTIKKIVHECLICTRYKHKVKSQIMAALPLERTSFTLPFTYVGADFAGPFQIKAGSLRNSPYQKSYVCIFVCFSTKAIHLEACSALTSDAFLATFARFIGRRGLPRCLMSDNGTNFVGANSILMREYQEFLKKCSKEVCEKYIVNGFEWKFIPPSAPHMGGLWEAGVKSFKSHFQKIMKDRKFNFEEFSTILVRIESVLNTRPLTPLSEDPEDLEALTPAHFLRGGSLIFAPEMPTEDLSLINRWEKIKALHHMFSKRWKNEYIQELHKRYKWQYPQRSLKENDMVLIKDELLPSNDWKMGRVLKVYEGHDDHVRVVDVKTTTGIISRPIVKLCVLPVSGC